MSDIHDTPTKAAVEFLKLYYQLDSAMKNRLCDNLAMEEENNVVTTYIQTMATQARERGYDIGYMKNTLFNIKTHTMNSSANSAVIRVVADMRKGIHPLFAYVGKLFGIGKTTALNQIVTVTKEGDSWKICEGFFPVSESL